MKLDSPVYPVYPLYQRRYPRSKRDVREESRDIISSLPCPNRDLKIIVDSIEAVIYVLYRRVQAYAYIS